jgi:carboxymethylenebutenolidase
MVKGWEGFELEAYRAMPTAKPRGGLVVLHEIFGVNPYVREKADFYASLGYAVLAPRFWDRLEKGVELDYTKADATRARRSFSLVIDRDLAVHDLGAVAEGLKQYGRVGAIGYSWGGTTAWMAAGVLDLACVVGYYAGTRRYSQGPRRMPVMLHQPERDRRIEPEDLEFLRNNYPDLPVYMYPADHGFDCADPRRRVYDAFCAALAQERTIAFISRHVG